MSKKDKARELLKKAAESLEEKPEEAVPQETASPEPPKAVLPEKRKRALITYMAILFATAFLLVALSLGIQYRDSRNQIDELGASASSAIAKADALQESNRQMELQIEDLNQEKETLSQRLAEANGNLSECKRQIQALEGEKQGIQAAQKELTDRARAYELLAQALIAQRNEDEEAYASAMEELKTLYQSLDQKDQAIYQDMVKTTEETEGE